MKNLSSNSVNLLINLAIAKVCDASVSVYSEVCGTFEDGVNQWVSHYVRDVKEVENKKYMGWEVHLDNLENKAVRFVVPTWVTDLVGDNTKTKTWKHKKNLFLKHIRVV